MGSLVIKQKPQCQTHIVWGWDLCAPKSFPKPHVSGFWFLSSVYILYCLILFTGHHSRVEVGGELKNSNQCQKQQAMPILIFKTRLRSIEYCDKNCSRYNKNRNEHSK